MREKTAIIPVEAIERRIFLIRGQKVMLDRDLAELYGVATKVFNQAVRRNLDRFPEDFMFKLTKVETSALRSQIVTLEKGRDAIRSMPRSRSRNTAWRCCPPSCAASVRWQ
jgi:hypothetical protein